jgi:hypothetical protein
VLAVAEVVVTATTLVLTGTGETGCGAAESIAA